MKQAKFTLPSSKLAPLNEGQIRRSLYLAALLTLLVPPFVGGSLMAIVGFYPLPEFYLVFGSYSGLYLALVATVSLLLLPPLVEWVIKLPRNPQGRTQTRARRQLTSLPWYFLTIVTLYSVFGAFSADYSLQSMGLHSYTAGEHLYHQFGVIPVVLLTSFPILFFLVDRLGRYLAPRGLSIRAVPLSLKMTLLGTVSPLLIDSLLIGYYYNRTGYFETETLLLWCSLLALAIGGTWLAWRSLYQGILPLEAFIESHQDASAHVDDALPTALSLDELGVLTTHFAELLTTRNTLIQQLQGAETLANTVIDHAGALVLLLDEEGRLVRFNRACEQLSGYQATDVIGRYPWEMLLPPEDAERVRLQAFEALAHDPVKIAGHYTNYWLSKDGGRHLIEWHNTLLLDQQQQMQHMISVGIDITERRAAEESLQRNREQLNEAQRLARIGSWSLDLQNNQLEWSDEIYRLFELDKEQFIPSYETFLNTVHPDDRDAVNQAYRTSLENRTPYEIVHRLQFPDGHIKYVREACETIYSDEGEALISRGTV